MEQKKKSFPRFYFVANGALLDILSNGNKPLKAPGTQGHARDTPMAAGAPPRHRMSCWAQVAEYLGDVFDGIRLAAKEGHPVALASGEVL